MRAYEISSGRTIIGVALLVASLALAGCQSGAANGDDAVTGVDTTAPPPPQGKILQSELRAYCPGVTVREGTASYSNYAKGGQGDATKIVYQASLAEATRTCTRADGNMTIKVAVAGRIVPGPMVQAGTVTLPIRVAVSQGQNVLYSQLQKYQVALTDTQAATQFVFSDPNVVIPIPEDGTANVFVGFDEGPKKDE